MQNSQKSARHSGGLSAPILLGSIVLIIGVLRWAREVVIPVSIAILLTFILSPVVNLLRRRGLGRVPAVIITVVCTVALLGTIGAVIALQFRGLANELPNYRHNILQKISDLRVASKGGAIQKVRDTVNEVLIELNKPEPNATNAPPAVPVVITREGVGSAAAPLVGPLLGQLATTGLVVALVIFMLLQREDLRGRLLRLAGHARLAANTKAVDEADRLVSSYLLRQCLINSGFGLGLGAGVYFIGLPYAVLWGFLGAVCRFVPYAGPILGAGSPVLLSLAVFGGWTTPLVIIGLVVGLELIINFIVEPLLYGQTTGVSPVALLVMIAFWTWLWGPIGLVLATPITVCLMVISKNIPGLQFLPLLLGREPALAPHQVFYERLVARDDAEAAGIIRKFRRDHSRAELFELLLIPALVHCRHDRNRRRINRADRQFILQSVRKFIETPEALTSADGTDEVAGTPARPSREQGSGHPEHPSIMGYPAGDEADELALLMLADLLRVQDWGMSVLSSRLLTSERLAALDGNLPAVVCCCALPEGRLAPVRQLCKGVRSRFPQLPIVAGLWAAAPAASAKAPRVLLDLTDAIGFTLAETRSQVIQFARLRPQSATRARAGCIQITDSTR